MAILPKMIHQTFAQMKEWSFIRELEGKKVIWNTKKDGYYDLGEIGTIIWESAATPITIDQIVSVLMEEYDITIVECRKQVDIFIHELLDEGLLVRMD